MGTLCFLWRAVPPDAPRCEHTSAAAAASVILRPPESEERPCQMAQERGTQLDVASEDGKAAIGKQESPMADASEPKSVRRRMAHIHSPPCLFDTVYISIQITMRELTIVGGRPPCAPVQRRPCTQASQ